LPQYGGSVDGWEYGRGLDLKGEFLLLSKGRQSLPDPSQQIAQIHPLSVQRTATEAASLRARSGPESSEAFMPWFVWAVEDDA
jgi:hypothetical protein